VEDLVFRLKEIADMNWMITTWSIFLDILDGQERDRIVPSPESGHIATGGPPRWMVCDIAAEQ
jgi:hypothetical protein